MVIPAVTRCGPRTTELYTVPNLRRTSPGETSISPDSVIEHIFHMPGIFAVRERKISRENYWINYSLHNYSDSAFDDLNRLNLNLSTIILPFCTLKYFGS